MRCAEGTSHSCIVKQHVAPLQHAIDSRLVKERPVLKVRNVEICCSTQSVYWRKNKNLHGTLSVCHCTLLTDAIELT
jgi:hypothetical protein